MRLSIIGKGLALGEQSNFTLGSDWPHPSFNGRFLPAQRSVTASGFEAEWRLSALASRGGQELLAGQALCAATGPLPLPLPGQIQMPATAGQPVQPCSERFGVAFIGPVSTDVPSDRATRYGLLFIVLGFVAVGLVEVMRRRRVHPVQHALVGSALALFFLLLGHDGTDVQHGRRAGLACAGGIGALYALLYRLLRGEQSAPGLGAVLLFAVQAADGGDAPDRVGMRRPPVSIRRRPDRRRGEAAPATSPRCTVAAFTEGPS